MVITSNATDFYISMNGNDANSGMSVSSAWRTIARVQQAAASFVPGDRILFERGGVYDGQLSLIRSGTQAAPIEIADYGSGSIPVISGSVPIGGWIPHEGNIYKTPLTLGTKYLFSNGEFQTLARTPNTGWFRVSTSNNTQLTSSDITQGNGYWNGGELVIRSTNWCYENATISANVGNGITYSNLTYNPGNYAWGFFLRNKLGALDMEGEWYHDAMAGMLYFWAPGNVDPNTLQIKAGVFDYGIKVGDWSNPINNILIHNIRFTGQKQAGVKTEGGCNNISVINCEFTKLYHGIDSYFGNFNHYDNNRFWDTYATAVHALDNNTTVNYNKLDSIAMVAGSGESFFGYYGIQVGGSNNVVRGNRLNNIGYSGIFCDSNALVELNFIKGHLMTLNDGGGIYWDSGSGVTVQDNIAMDPFGNMESVAMNYQTNVKICMGMYFGNAAITGARIRRNTAIRCEVGIIVDHTMASSDNQITDNVLFGNRNFQIGFADYSNTNGPAAIPPYAVSNYNDVFSGNTCYAMSNTQYIAQFVNVWYDGVDFGTFTNNKYYNPWNTNSFTLEKFIPSYSRSFHNLAQWVTMHGGEAGAVGNTTSLVYPNGVNDHIIVYNDSLTQQDKLLDGIWFDLDGNQYAGHITLGAFRSRVLVRGSSSFHGKVMLQGALNGNAMSDDLGRYGLIPIDDPYPQLGYTHIGGSTADRMNSDAPAQDAIVDWVLLEFRRPDNSVMYSRSALVQRDGDIVDVDGISDVQLPQSVNGQSYIVIRHRNHLGVMTAFAVAAINKVYAFDFTTMPTWGVNAQNDIDGIKAMWAGDCNMNGSLKYTGTNNDRDLILSAIGGSIPTNMVNGYLSEDVNLDGVVKYTGSNNDRDVILVNIGGSIPTNVRNAQLP